MSDIPQVSKRTASTLVAIAATVATLLAGAGSATAASGGANNVVRANATGTAMTVLRSNIQFAPVGAPTITSSNVAEATSTDCTGCRAAAAAFQAIFIIRGMAATVVAPANVAIASNGGCTDCDSFAFADQDVVTTAGPVFLSEAAQQAIVALRGEVADTLGSGAPDSVLNTELTGLATQFHSIIANDLQQAGVPAQASLNQRVATAPQAS